MTEGLVPVWITVGAAIGALARFELSRLWIRRHGDAFPWATLLINLAGAFLAGLLLAGEGAASGTLVRILTAGILGGFTTVSSFSLEVLLMIERGRQRAALAYAGGSMIGGPAAAALGLGLGALT